MPFFQNPFTSDFYGVWVLGDRHASVDFVCPRNAGRGDEMVTAWSEGPYDLSGDDADSNSNEVLILSFAMNDSNNWTDLSITISGASLSAVTPSEVMTSLNNNTTFADWFTASLEKFTSGFDRLIIRSKWPITKMKFYVKNGRAESVLRFNKLSGVSELPAFFDKHSIANVFTLPEGPHQLIKLGTTGVDATVVNGAVDKKGNSLNYVATSVKKDYELLRGRSGLFTFKKNTIDGSNRITQTIEYPAGAQTGDFAKKINYTYTSSNTNPTTVTEIPYVLVSGDILTP